MSSFWQVCVPCINVSEFKKNFKHILSAFQDMQKNEVEFIVCTTEQRIDEYSKAIASAKPKANVFLFSANMFEDFCHKELGVWFFGESLGHARNCLLLASHILNPEAHVVMLGEDSIPSKSTVSAYSDAFRSYDVVQGSVIGQVKNSAYAMVYFFQALERGEQEHALKILSGNWKFKEKTVGVSGFSASNYGVRANLKLGAHFAPNNTFAEHFYEFSLRLLNNTAKFFDDVKDPAKIPEVVCEPKTYYPGYLVDSYAQVLRDAITESFFYYKTVNCIPRIIEGKHSLLAIKEFDIEAIAEMVSNDAALPKFKKAAEHYLKQGKLVPEVEEQVRKILWLDKKQYVPSGKDLFADWAAFQEEGSKFKNIIENVSSAPESIKEKLVELAKVSPKQK